MVQNNKNLTPLAVAKLTKPGMHFVGHIAGLALRISTSGARSWILRATVGGRRRDIGLGSFPEVSLADVREAASKKRQQIRDGIDPIVARQTALAALKAEQASFMTFKDAALQYIAAHEAAWMNPKHAAQWRSTLVAYAYPEIGALRVNDISLSHVLKILEPIWKKKTETASRVRGRIEAILDWATVRGYRRGDNPARWKGTLDAVLPTRSSVAPVKHFRAIPWHECPAAFAAIQKIDKVSARALEFSILTNCRSGKARNALWSQIDLERRVWSIPRSKGPHEHRIPLSAAAVALLEKLPKDGNDLVFPNLRGSALSDMALLMLLRRKNLQCTVHGFRSSFRDWAGETTSFPREVIEQAMAHHIKDKSEAAYARGDLFTKRIGLMEAWANFLLKTTGQILQIPAAVENVNGDRKKIRAKK